MFYHRGEQWYKDQFPAQKFGNKIFDPTYTYIRSPWAPRRIADDHPEAKFILCLRNPVERAFSHYWHEKKKQKIAFEFNEVLENYDLYSSWIEPGLYAEHIERYQQCFERDQFLFLRFEDLKQNPQEFLNNIFTFVEVDTGFRPSILDKKSNAATGRKTPLNKGWYKIKSIIADIGMERPLKELNVDKAAKKIESLPIAGKLLNDKDEYEKGVPAAIRTELLYIIEPEIERLEKLLDINLKDWKK
jgi:hypothetical protein